MAKRVFTEEERAEYREKMLDAGFDLLKQYGMTHMSVAKITEAAGIGVSTFYNFFSSKEEYVYEVLQYRRRKIPELIRIALNGKEKAGPAETRTYLKMMIDERYSVFPSLTPEDEKRLLEMLPEQARPDLQKETETEQNGGNADPDKQQLVHTVPCCPAERRRTGAALFRFLLENLFHIVNPIPWFRNIPLYIIV